MLSLRSFVALLVVVCCVQLVAGTPPLAPFSICYKFVSKAYLATSYVVGGRQATQPQQALDTPYSISVQLNGFYNTTNLTETQATNRNDHVNGTYVVLYNITSGTRTTKTRNGGSYPATVQKLDPIGTDYADNRLYLSNSSQWVDGDGITFNWTSLVEFPGKEFLYTTNIYRVGTTGLFVEDSTSSINGTGESFAVNGVLGWTGARFTTCTPNPLPSGGLAQLAVTKNVNYTVDVSYFFTNSANFNITFAGTFSGASTNVPDNFGDNYLLLTKATGTRQYCTYGTLSSPTCRTSTVTGIAPLKSFGFVDNRAYLYPPYLDYNGPGYTISPAQPKPGYAFTTGAVNTTTIVNIYYSKGGTYLEGFGAGGTGPNGQFNTSATIVNISPP